MANTPNFDLNLPASGASGWGDLLNSNFTALDSGLAAASADAALALQQIANLPPSGGTSSSVSARQAPLMGPRDANGYANYILAGEGLTATLHASSADPVVISFANGFGAAGPVDDLAIIEADATWTLAANATNYVYADITSGTVSLGATVRGPVYGDLFPISVGANVAATSNAIANGVYSGAYPAANAFDGNGGSYWCGTHGGTTGDWVGQDFGGTPRRIGRVYLNQFPTGGGDSAGSVKVQYCNDGGDLVNWVDATSSIAIVGSVATIDLVNPVFARAWRVIAMSPGSGYAGQWAVYEVSMFEMQDPAVGSDWFNIGRMKMSSWSPSASAWADSKKVFLGEIVTDAVGVTSIVTYALNACYLSPETMVSPGTTYNFNHNIGVPASQVVVTGALRDVTNGWILPYTTVTNYDYQHTHNNYGALTRLTYRARFGGSYTMGYVTPTGGQAQVGAANGAGLTIIVKRAW